MTDFLLGGDLSADPIVPGLPNAAQSLARKYQTLGPTLGSVPQPILSSLYQYDLQKAMAGSQPLSIPDTQRVLYSAINNTQATPAPTNRGRGVLGSLGALIGNVGSDIRNITAAIPKLPFTLAHEVEALPQAPQAISQALNQGDFQALSQAPGVRLIPGSYTLGNILGGNLGEIVQHPVVTALDVLPLAKEVAPSLAQTALGEQAIDLAGRAKQAVLRTGPGLYAQMAWGQDSRELSAMAAAEDRTLRSQFTPGGVAANGDELTTLAQRAADYGKSFKAIPVDRRVELTNAMESDPRSLLNTPLTDDERAYVDQGRLLTDTIGRYNLSQNLLTDVNGEFYLPEQASKLLSYRSARDAAVRTNEVRSMVTSGSADPSEVASAAQQVIGDNSLSKRSQAQLLRGYAHALDAGGYDSTDLLSTVRQVERTSGADWSPVLDHFQSDFAQRPAMSQNDLIDSLAGQARTDPTVARLADNVAQGNWQQARNLAKTLSRRGTYTVDTIDDMLDSISRNKDQQAWLDKTSSFSDAQVAKLDKKYNDALAATAPARYQSYIQGQVRNQLLERYAADPNFPAISKYLEMGYYRGVPGIADEADQLSKELSSTWQDMKANGIDPVFIHRVTPAAATSLDFPHITDAVRTPGQLRARTGDISPYVHDATVAIPHQALELLTRRRTEAFVNSVMDHFGSTADDLLPQYLPAAERIAARNPQLDTLTVAQGLMQKEYEAFDPNSIITWKGAQLSNFGDQTLIPKAISRNMQLMFHPPLNRLTTLLDPVMKLYRTALLPLSLRFQVNHLFGHLALTTAEDPQALAFLGKARELIKSGEYPEDIGRGMGAAPREFVEWDKLTPGLAERGLNVLDQYHFAGGQTLRRIYDQVANAGSNVVSKSYGFAQVTDDMYRAAAYLSGKDRALTAGMTEAEAHTAGVTLARKIFMQWDEMTPIERSVMRSVIPFYGWASHILRYTANYPFDHPWRASIINSFARAELNDQQAGLGTKWLSSFFLGHPDSSGNVKAVSINGINPFRDVANYMTLAGFVGQTNPIAQVALERLGIDPTTGKADLYPSLEYDPVSGRVAMKSPGLFSSVISNFVPQANVVMGMMGMNTDFKQLARTNPDAAANLLRSQLGLPVIFKNVNLPQEEFKTELARHQAQQLALSNALKTGNWSDAADYPGLAPYLHQIQTLQAGGQLQQYTPQQPSEDELALLNQAVVLSNTP